MSPSAIQSPLAPKTYPTLPAISGVRLATIEAGIRHKNRKDVLLVELASGTQVAGVFTQSKTASAPVLAARDALKYGTARALIVNSGNSNAFTGKAGEDTVREIRDALCKQVGCEPTECFMASTGVIGEKMPAAPITNALPKLHAALTDNAWLAAAQAIMTTDTYPKLATRSVTLGGKTVTINGIAKGSGMIAPDMATMLAFVFTDAAISHTALQDMLEHYNQKTFNSITVDGDTSTSDMLMLFATGKAGNDTVQDAHDASLTAFKKAFHEILHELALHIVKDGEGAQRLVHIHVGGAEHDAAAHRIGMSIANSPLVKTALAASDANWGRIVMAVGKAGEKANRDKLCICIGGVSVAKNGEVDPTYKEEAIDAHMQGQKIAITVDVGIANGTADVWTCDLTHRYIDINGAYRT